MTQKELSYLEDAIGHEKNIISICTDTLDRLEDENLVSFLNNQINEHNTLLDNLMNKLEEKANE